VASAFANGGGREGDGTVGSGEMGLATRRLRPHHRSPGGMQSAGSEIAKTGEDMDIMSYSAMKHSLATRTWQHYRT